LTARLQFIIRPFWEAAVATWWTFVLMRYVVFEFVFTYGVFYGRDPRPGQVEVLADFAGGVGAAILLALFVARGASRVAREDPRRALERGALVGAASVVLLNGAVALWFPPVDPAEIALHLPAALVGGLIGAAYGCRSHAVTEAVRRAHLAIARARRPEEVATAIGENLLGGSGKRGAVLLWRVPPEEAPDRGRNEGASAVPYELCAAWPALDSWPIGARLPEKAVRALASLRGGWPRPEPVRRLPGDLRLLLPFGSASVAALSTGGAPVGLLVFVLPQRARSVARACLDAAPLAAQQLTIFRQERLAERSGVRSERERLADEIHDTVIQGCIAVGNRIEDVRGIDRLEDEDRRELALALKISRDTVEEARLFVRALNTDHFSRDLPRLLAAEAEDFREETGIRVRTATEGEPFPLPPNVGVVLFKAAREGMANVGKHAGASAVDLVLSYGSGRVSLEVRDDGVGPDGSEAVGPEPRGRLVAGGHGLKAMRRLVRNAGGSLHIGEAPGGGTTLSVRFEVGPPAATPTVPAAGGPR
jgi:signal transduction histidine kinase